ncbi:MAG: hypothetical protein ACOYU0_03120 [Nitrospirota bacterium]
MKVIGRDIWLRIWSFIFALIACLKWEKEEIGTRPDVVEIWWRFPKFVLGFVIASRFRELAAAGKKPSWAFTIGVAVNATLGFILSILVLADFWISKTAQ